MEIVVGELLPEVVTHTSSRYFSLNPASFRAHSPVKCPKIFVDNGFEMSLLISSPDLMGLANSEYFAGNFFSLCFMGRQDIPPLLFPVSHDGDVFYSETEPSPR